MGHVESMVAIYISYDRPQISIFPVFSLPTTSSYPERSCFFVNSRVMGFCTPSSIVFWCMNASAEVQERPEIFLQPVRNQFAAFRLYLPDAQETIRMRPCLQLGHRIYHFERGLTSDPSVQSIPFVVAESDYWTDDGPHTVTLSVSYPFDSEALRASGNITAKMFFYAHHLFSPEYGVFATTCRDFTWDGHHTSVVHFWPGKSTADETLDVGQGYFYEVPDRIRQTAVSASGRYMLLVHTGNYYLGRNNIHEYLGLLHFNLTPTPHITFRKLDVGVMTSESCDQIAIDDALGLVFVVDIAGMVTIYSFV